MSNVINFAPEFKIKFWLLNHTSEKEKARNSRPEVLFKKFTGRHLCRSFFLNKIAGWMKVCYFIKKKLRQMFSCDKQDIFKNTYFAEHLRTAAS